MLQLLLVKGTCLEARFCTAARAACAVVNIGYASLPTVEAHAVLLCPPVTHEVQSGGHEVHCAECACPSHDPECLDSRQASVLPAVQKQCRQVYPARHCVTLLNSMKSVVRCYHAMVSRKGHHDAVVTVIAARVQKCKLCCCALFNPGGQDHQWQFCILWYGL